MSKRPAAELNRYLERLAMWLKDNKPSYIKRYGVSVSHMSTGPDTDTIFLKVNLEISNNELVALMKEGVVEIDA